MKKEYDFSQGKKGKFYHSNIKVNLPIYLEPETFLFVKKIAKKKDTDLSTIVNKLIKTDMKLAQVID